jgi:hypothetical protein
MANTPRTAQTPQPAGLSDGWQTFMRMAGLYNPQAVDQNMGAPPMQQPMVNRPSSGQHMPGQYGYQAGGGYDENIDVEVERPGYTGQFGSYGGNQSPILDAFRQSVLNPPQREHPTYAPNTLAGLQKGFEVAATPTDYEKNRVYVGGHPYQQVKAYKDPATGQTQFINKYKQPGFWEQFMKSMPAAVGAMPDVLNQPYKDAVFDYELKNKGLTAGANAEAQMALTGYRDAQARAVPGTTQARLMTAEAALSRANTAERLAILKDLSDSERLELVQRNKISQIEAQQAGRMAQITAQQGGANERNAANIKSRETIARAQIAGRMSVAELNNLADEDLENLKHDHSIVIEGVKGAVDRELVIERAKQARATKAAPSGTAGATSQIPTQQKVAEQERVNQFKNAYPRLASYVSINMDGFAQIEPPSKWWGDPGPTQEQYKEIFRYIYGKEPPSQQQPAAPIQPQPSAGNAPTGQVGGTIPPVQPVPPGQGENNRVNQTPIGGTNPQAATPPQTAPAPLKAAPGTVLMTTPDGKSTRSVPTGQVEAAKKLGYKPAGGQ